MSAHLCHAHGCDWRVQPRMLFCLPHWKRLREPLQEAIWRDYRPGQERDKRPSLRYLCVQQRAIGEVAFKPFDEQAAAIAAPYLLRSEMLRRECIDEGFGDPLEGICKVAA